MLDAIHSPSGPILNALNFPLPLHGVAASALSSEVEAWILTQRLPFCPMSLAFPTGQMRWGLAATQGSRHWIHVDSDGLGTFISPQCGSKWWILFSPPDGENKHSFASVDQFLDSFDIDFDQDGSRWDIGSEEEGVGRWIAEGLYLTPGTQL
jgi:hypothetical protein